MHLNAELKRRARDKKTFLRDQCKETEENNRMGKTRVPLVSLIFLKRSLQVFSILLFSSISLHRLLRKAFLSLLAILWNSASNGFIYPFLLCFLLLFFSQLFVRPPQMAILLFCICFSWGWSWSLSPIQCHEPPSIILQALCLSDLILWIYFSLPLYSHKGFDLGYFWMV